MLDRIDPYDLLIYKCLIACTQAGYAKIQNKALLLKYETISTISEEDRQNLHLNDDLGWKLSLRTQGIIGSGQCRLNLVWTSPQGEYKPDLIPIPCGFYSPKTTRVHVLPQALIALRDAVDAKENIHTLIDQIRYMATIKTCLIEARKVPDYTIEVDTQFEHEQYHVADKVRVSARLDTTRNTLELRPLIDGLNDFDAALNLLKAHPLQHIVHVSPSNQRAHHTRIARTEEALEATNIIRRSRWITEEELEAFIQDPASFLFRFERKQFDDPNWTPSALDSDSLSDALNEHALLSQLRYAIGQLEARRALESLPGLRPKSPASPTKTPNEQQFANETFRNALSERSKQSEPTQSPPLEPSPPVDEPSPPVDEPAPSVDKPSPPVDKPNTATFVAVTKNDVPTWAINMDPKWKDIVVYFERFSRLSEADAFEINELPERQIRKLFQWLAQLDQDNNLPFRIKSGDGPNGLYVEKI